MRIYTRIILDMTKDDLPVIESESFEYSGEVALCMPSDGAGGRSGGDGDRGSGGSSDSERGGGGSESGGRDMTGVNGPVGTADRDMAGNRTGRNGDGSFGSNREGTFGINANKYGQIGTIAGMGLSAITGVPGLSFAGSAIGKTAGMHADQAANIAAAQKGMPDSARGFANGSSGLGSAGNGSPAGVGGTGSDGRLGSEGGKNNVLSFSDGMNGAYQIPKATMEALQAAAAQDSATQAFLNTLNKARSHVSNGADLIAKHNKNVEAMNAHSAKVFGKNNYTAQDKAVSLQTNPNPKQYDTSPTYAQRALSEIEEAKRLGAKIYVR